MLYPIIDAHHHFWKFDRRRDGWITAEMKKLQRDYLPSDLEPVLADNEIAGTVVVQSDRSENENKFQLELADRYSFIRGVVGWIDLQADNIEEKLSYYRHFTKLKGFREILQGDVQRDRMLDPAFRRGIGLLGKYGFSYDLLILPDQIEFAETLVAAYPDQRFVIDHLAKPNIRAGTLKEWQNRFHRFAIYKNVYCKVSGMVNEADWENWSEDQFRPYLSSVVETFGMKRIMFGSDWPVCLVAGDYRAVKQIVYNYFSSFTLSEQADFFGGNAMEFYHLD